MRSEDIVRLISSRVNEVLLYAQASMQEHQFRAYRKLVLNAFGRSGLGKDVERLLHGDHRTERDGTGRNEKGQGKG